MGAGQEASSHCFQRLGAEGGRREAENQSASDAKSIRGENKISLTRRAVIWLTRFCNQTLKPWESESVSPVVSTHLQFWGFSVIPSRHQPPLSGPEHVVCGDVAPETGGTSASPLCPVTYRQPVPPPGSCENRTRAAGGIMAPQGCPHPNAQELQVSDQRDFAGVIKDL